MKLWTAMIVALLAGCASTGSQGKNPDATAQFERLKTMQGVWSNDASEGGPNARSEVEYHLTGGGSVLVETIMRGTPHEMVTMYHLDHGDLVLTHYCALGNQPTMRAMPGDDSGRVQFTCTGGGNLDCGEDRHMHAHAFEFVDRDHVRSMWTLVDHSKTVEDARFTMVRKAN